MLHAHCMKHSDWGSYHFDSFTRTAFPKYDTTCSYSQYELTDIEKAVNSQSNVVDKENEITVEVENVETSLRGKRKLNSNESVRVLRKRRKKLGTSDGVDRVDSSSKGRNLSVGNVKHTDRCKHSSARKIDGTETDRNENDNSAKEDYIRQGPSQQVNITEHDSHKTALANIKTEPEENDNSGNNESAHKDKHFDPADEGNVSELVENQTLGDQEAVLKGDASNSENEHEEDHTTQKKDEQTATEVLLAIGKGDSKFGGSESGRKSSPASAKKGRRNICNTKNGTQTGSVRNGRKKDRKGDKRKKTQASTKAGSGIYDCIITERFLKQQLCFSVSENN